MGLDMYLRAKRYVSNFDFRPDDKELNQKIRESLGLNHLNDSDGLEVSVTVGYWRKANQVHQWFVDNVQRGEDDCKSYWLDINDLMKLLNVCKDVMDDFHKTGGVSAHALLPREQGFFFGSEEYDEYYFDDVSKTINIIENLLSEVDEKGYFPGDLYYSSSW